MATPDEPQEDSTADEIGSQLVRLVRLIERKQARYHAEHPDAVERATYLLLVHLVKDGPRRAGALADAVHSDPSTVSRQVAHLVRLGLVERTADPVDGRATLLAATAEGRRVFEENRQLRHRAHRRDDWPDWSGDDRRRVRASCSPASPPTSRRSSTKRAARRRRQCRSGAEEEARMYRARALRRPPHSPPCSPTGRS